jgi:UDP-N-acetylmuramoyl-L-alanyl-D-glutamate--2,6-diaminopimelate ligase
MTAMPPRLNLHSLRDLVAGFVAGAPELTVNELTLDSRHVTPGALFLACRGTRAHGLDHLPQAIAQGTAAVLWEPAPGISAPDAPVPVIAVEDLSRRAGEIAARFFGQPSRQLHCIGVTGTDGKTSTTHLIAQALEQLGQPCLYVGTLGAGRVRQLEAGDHTTPDPVSVQRGLRRAADQGCVAVAMEVSSHALDQHRVGGVDFHTAALTNVGRDHLDYHGTVEAYAAAKRRLFFERELQAVILNRDDEFGAQWIHAHGRLTSHVSRLTSYGIDGDTRAGGRHVLARSLNLTADGLRFEVQSHAGTGFLRSRLLGRFNVYNLLATLAVLLERGVPLDAACAALAQAATVPGRIEGFRGPAAQPLVVVDYAHTPQALAQVLQALRPHVAGNLWCVFGCGGDRDRGKRPLMGAAAVQHADRLIVTDDNPRSEDPAVIVSEIVAGIGRPVEVIHDRAAAITSAVREAGAGDVVVVAGKGHEDYQIYGTERRPFSDRAFVAGLVGSQIP